MWGRGGGRGGGRCLWGDLADWQAGCVMAVQIFRSVDIQMDSFIKRPQHVN